MKRYLIFVLSVVMILSAVIYYLNLNYNRRVSTTGTDNYANSSGKSDLCRLENLRAGSYSENSIYQLNNVWINQDNNKLRLSGFYGKQVVLAMIYTSCPTACPVIVSNMKRIESEILGNELDNYHFVLVSIDPERDTPGQLKKFAAQNNLNLKRWTLLTGSSNDIAELSQTIGFRYKESHKGLFIHSNLITFLNSKGEIAFQNEGLNLDKSLLITSLNK